MDVPDQSSAGLVAACVARHGPKPEKIPMMSDQPLPPAQSRDLQAVFALLEVAADPKATRARIEALDAKIAEHAQMVAKAGNSAKERKAFEAELAEKRKAADGELEHTRAQHDQEWNQRHTSLIAREKRAEEREADLDRRDRELASREAALNARDRKFKEAIGAA